MTIRINFTGIFIASKVGLTSLTPTINVYTIVRATGVATKTVNDGATVEIGDGVYMYSLASADLDANDYFAVMNTASVTADQQTVLAPWVSYSPANNAAAIADAVLDELVADHSAAGSVSMSLRGNAAATADAVLDELLAEHDVAGSTSLALQNVLSGTIVITSPLDEAHSLTLVSGDDYFASESRALDFSSDTWPDISEAVIKFIASVDGSIEIIGEATAPTTVRIEIGSAKTAELGTGKGKYLVCAIFENGHVITIVPEGNLLIQKTTV